MIILLATKLQNSSLSAKASSSWSLESHLYSLHSMIINGSMVCFSHVRRKGTQVVDILANLGVGTCKTVKAKDWDMIPDLTAFAQYKDLIQTEGTYVQM